MKKLLVVLALGLLALTANAAESAAQTNLFVVNNSPETVTSVVATAPDGTRTDLASEFPMRGNDNGWVTLRSNTPGTCVYTLDIAFKNGRKITVTDYDACNYNTLHTRKAYQLSAKG